MAISMPMFVLTALKTEKTTKRLNEMIYIVRRPRVSEKDDLVRVSLSSHIDEKNDEQPTTTAGRSTWKAYRMQPSYSRWSQ